jgi:predicted TIM-barrel fold metal-dependent hydrolase
MASGLGVLRHADLTETQRALVLGTNARKLLGI